MHIEMPAEAVRLLNALYRASDDAASALQAFDAARAQARQWITFHASFSTCEDEARILANIGFLWDDVDDALSGAPATISGARLAPTLLQAYGLMRAIERERMRAAACDDALGNDLVLAGLAVLDGRASLDCLRMRLTRWTDHAQTVAAQIALLAPALPRRVHDAARTGLSAIRHAGAHLEQALETADTHVLARALAEIRYAAEEVGAFVTWQRDVENETVARHAAYQAVPRGIGCELAEMLARAREMSRDGWAFGLRRARHLLDVLEAHWRDSPDRHLVALDAPANIVTSVADAIDAARSAVAAMRDASGAAEGVFDLATRALQRLSRAFTDLQAHRIDGVALPFGFASEACERIRAVCVGAAPDICLESLLEEGPEVCRNRIEVHVRRYLEDGDHASLRAALATLADLAEADATPAPSASLSLCA